MNESDLTHIGAMFQKMRKYRKLSQDALAEKTGVTRVYIGMLERGTVNPSLEVLMKLASALDCNLDLNISPK